MTQHQSFFYLRLDSPQEVVNYDEEFIIKQLKEAYTKANITLFEDDYSKETTGWYITEFSNKYPGVLFTLLRVGCGDLDTSTLYALNGKSYVEEIPEFNIDKLIYLNK